MKKSAVVLLALMVTLLVMLCSAAYAAEKINDIQFVSGNTGGGWAAQAAVICDRVNQHFDGFPCNAVPGGSIANPPLLEQGKAQVGMSQGPFLGAAIKGIAPYDKPMTNLRAVCAMVPCDVFWIVSNEFKGETLGEVLKNAKGLKMGMTPKGNSTSYVSEYILDKYGIKDLDEIKKLGGKITYADQASLQNAWSDRNIDVYTYNTARPASIIAELLTVRESRLVGLEDDVIDKLVKENGFMPSEIPANTFPNQPKPIKTVALSTVILCRADVPDILTYTIAKTIHDEKSYLDSAQAAFKGFDVKDMAKGLVFECHPGALKYYKEIGLVK
ncbi:MAG: TAXI family TRAP transporter solute-binding subunit [Synergistes sp.]|nr:TAXI family TRAP transporter solute-binding subunit [Synergistes sp.]